MALPVPNLDDRTFQDLVNEVRRRIPVHCPEWTDHNLSDPGITLIEMFAWMTELILYRLNKVPDKNYVKFLELIGVNLTPASPATTEVTFRLAAPAVNAITIPSGTEVATVRTESEEAIVFTTDANLVITPPELEHFGFVPNVSGDDTLFEDQLAQLLELEALYAGLPLEQGVSLFQNIPEPESAFCLGFSTDLRGQVLSLTLDCIELTGENAVRGIVPSNPPLLWEYWDDARQRWEPFERRPDSAAWLEADSTMGLLQRGQVVLHVPQSTGRTTLGLREAYWVRCKIIPYHPSHGAYTSSPQLRSIECQAIGGTARVTNVTQVDEEELGISDGTPGQVLRVSQGPMLPLTWGETVEVEGEDNTGWEPWAETSDFSQCGPDDKVFRCDPVAGEILFGPVIRSPNGEDTRYGATPPRGAHIRLTSYRFGGGPQGNVGRRTLNVLKSSIPYVALVTNHSAATGGVEPESVESAKMRGPQVLRTMNRAVTAEDFEHLAREASPSVGRVHCVQPQQVGEDGAPPPGVVQVLLVPTLPVATQSLAPAELRVPQQVLDLVKEYLEERRLLTTAVIVSEPDYVWVSVEAKVHTRRGLDADEVKLGVAQKLYQFIHPLYGGGEGTGWPFGRDLFVSELYSQIQQVNGVDYTEELRVYRVDPNTGSREEVAQVVPVPRSGLLCSHDHTVV